MVFQFWLILTVLLAELLVCIPGNVRAITFNDGLVHVIDAEHSFPLESVFVEDSGIGDPTVLRIVDGGQVSTVAGTGLQVSGGSVVEMSGGEVHEVFESLDTSSVSITGGASINIRVRHDSHLSVWGGIANNIDCEGVFIYPRDRIPTCNLFGGDLAVFRAGLARVNIYDGIITDRLYTQSGFDILVAGGTIAAVFLGGGGNAEISGGSVGGRLQVGDAELLIFDGEFAGELAVQTGASTRVAGGTFTGPVRPSGDGVLSIYGGSLLGDLIAVDTSVVEIFGSGFNFPFGDITATSGTLTGTLTDGTTLHVDFARASTATITLPEPSGLAALASNVAVLILLTVLKARENPAKDSGGGDRADSTTLRGPLKWPSKC